MTASVLLPLSILPGSGRAATADEPGVVISSAWIRAMPPTQRNTAAYLAVTNQGSSPLEIVGATSNLTEQAEIHVSREVDGYMHMEQLHSLPLAPGETLQLTPGGIHLMLLNLANMPAPGSRAELCLVFSSGQSACVTAPVKKSVGSKEDHGHEHHGQEN
jgi:copper(I)-binding protein